MKNLYESTKDKMLTMKENTSDLKVARLIMDHNINDHKIYEVNLSATIYLF